MTGSDVPARWRLGVDLGGTKIEAAILDESGRIIARDRVPTPSGHYEAIVRAVADLALRLEAQHAEPGALTIGICTPGAISPATGLQKNANSTCLNGRPLKQDLERALGREIRTANDADCLAVSEAVDGAAAGAGNVFAVILGTGCGGGLYVNGALVQGPNAIAGEWGHNPLPWPRADWDELPGPRCWHGAHGCLETWISGPAVAADHARRGSPLPTPEIVAGMRRGDPDCTFTMERWFDRCARAFASVINVLDPHVIVVGGGLSLVQELYEQAPARWGRYVFSDRVDTRLVPAMHGDASGVRGAAWLWP